MKLATFLLATACICPQFPTPAQGWSVNRRAFLARSGTLMVAILQQPAVAYAKEDDEEQRRKQQAEKQAKQQAEKEARRLAEETKKRLAVGRIGAF